MATLPPGDRYIDTGPGQVPEEVNAAGQVIAIGITGPGGVPINTGSSSSAATTSPASTSGSTPPSSSTGTSTTGTGAGTGGSATAGYTVPPLGGSPGTTLTSYNPLDPFQMIDSIWQDLTGITGAVTSVPQALGMIAQVLRDVGSAMTWLESAFQWFFVPSHWVRIAAGTGGLITGIPGFYALMKAGQGSGDVTLALGILLTTVSAVLWFIAFHNIPSDVSNLQELLAWMAEGIKAGKGVYDTGPAPMSGGLFSPGAIDSAGNAGANTLTST